VTGSAALRPGRRWDSRQRLLLVGLVSLITIVATEAMAVATIMPAVEDDLGSLWLYGWVFSAFQLGILVGIVAGGLAADRTNPAVPIAAGMAVFGVGLVVAALAPSMGVLVGGRLLQGLGAGVIPTVSYVCVGRGFAPLLRPGVFAVMSAAWVLPSLVAPLVASGVVRAVGWRWVFGGLIPVVALAGLLAVQAVRGLGAPPDPGVRSGGDLAAVARLVCGSAVLLAGTTADRWWVGLPLVLFGAGVLVPAFRRLTPAGTVALRPRLPAAVGLRGILTFSFFSVDAFVPLAVTSVRGRTTLFAGMVIASGAVTWAIGSWAQARLHEDWGAARLVRAGGAVVLVSLLVYGAGLHDTVPVWTWFVGSMLAGAGMGIAYSPLSVVTLAEATAGREGRATTSLQLSDVLGVAVGTGLAGAVVALGDRIWTTNAPAFVGILLLGALSASVLVRGAGRLVGGVSPAPVVTGSPERTP